MNVTIARTIARRIHADQRTRTGEPVIDHVERVAKVVPERCRALAYLHDVLERSDSGAKELLEHELTGNEFAVLTLLTRDTNEPYRSYVMRIARASGASGRIARTIKLADLNDHLCRPSSRAARPNYAWARRQILLAATARGDGSSIPQTNVA